MIAWNRPTAPTRLAGRLIQGAYMQILMVKKLASLQPTVRASHNYKTAKKVSKVTHILCRVTECDIEPELSWSIPVYVAYTNKRQMCACVCV